LAAGDVSGIQRAARGISGAPEHLLAIVRSSDFAFDLGNYGVWMLNLAR
jgi:hypothetical protein